MSTHRITPAHFGQLIRFWPFLLLLAFSLFAFSAAAATLSEPASASCPIEGCEPTDSDGDGIPNTSDNCPSIENPGQEDLDGDSVGDECDPDDDNDTVADSVDNCPTISNVSQFNSDWDPDGDDCDSDDDDDGVSDGPDNCVLAANLDQTNTDGDANGDACDLDDDDDTISDDSDNCALVANSDQANRDGDEQGDACDADDDGDGVADASDACPLVSGTASNGCIPLPVADTAPSDRDGDGVADASDQCPNTAAATATGCETLQASDPKADQVAPSVSNQSLLKSKFKSSDKNKLRYTLSESATVVVTLSRVLAGRKVGKKCVAPNKKYKTRVACIRSVTNKKRLVINSLAGANKRNFPGKWAGKRLAAGSYTLTLVATDASGNAGAPVVVKFLIVR